MPKFNINEPVRDFLGKPLKLQDFKKVKRLIGNEIIEEEKLVETEENFTFRHLIGNILNTVDNRNPDTPEDKNKIFQLCLKIYSAKKEIELSAESDIPFILKRAGKFASPLQLGRLKEFLDPKK